MDLKFDIDKQSRKLNRGDFPRMVVKLLKRTAKSPNRYFIVVKRDNNFIGVFHGIGFWTSSLEDLTGGDLTEVWIPYENIDYVESLTYNKK